VRPWCLRAACTWESEGERQRGVSEGAGSLGVAQQRARRWWGLPEGGRRWEDRAAAMLCSTAQLDERGDSAREKESESEQDEGEVSPWPFPFSTRHVRRCGGEHASRCQGHAARSSCPWFGHALTSPIS
jgi:hypothetical protein